MSFELPSESLYAWLFLYFSFLLTAVLLLKVGIQPVSPLSHASYMKGEKILSTREQ